MNKTRIAAVAGALLMGAVAYGGYRIGLSRGMASAQVTTSASNAAGLKAGDVEMLLVLASNASLAVANARLIKRLLVAEERLQKVRVALDEVVSADDPVSLYNRLVRRAAKRTDGGSGLGLGRIRAEADLALSYAIDGDTIAVTAEGHFMTGAS